MEKRNRHSLPQARSKKPWLPTVTHPEVNSGVGAAGLPRQFREEFGDGGLQVARSAARL
jgi:hypothetical protein